MTIESVLRETATGLADEIRAHIDTKEKLQTAEARVKELESQDAAVGRLFRKTADREAALLSRVAELEAELARWKQPHRCSTCKHLPSNRECCLGVDCGLWSSWEPA